MGGALIDTLRQWCRHRWSRLNSPCIASDAVAPESTSLDSKPAQKLAHPTLPTRSAAPQLHTNSWDFNFFTEYGERNRYLLQEVIGKGSYGIVCSAIDTYTGERVAIKKITDIFEHVSDATRILREIKLLRLLRHPDIVEIKHIMLPPSPRNFKDIYVIFELMESDLHQVIKANDDLTAEHYCLFLYQLLRALKFIHSANVFHRDLKPKNVLANADCKLKICDFGLARVSFDDAPTAIFWTDYVATRWYRAPELCGSFFSKYTPAVDIWSIGCIFAEILGGKPLFPGKNVVHQLDLITDLLGTPPAEATSKIRNDKARKYLSGMRKKLPVSLSQKFPNVDPQALCLLNKLLAFDPKDRPTAEKALADPYFKGLAKIECEPSALPIAKVEFDFERRKVSKEDVKYLIYREILEYHPQMLEEYLRSGNRSHFLYPSAVDQLRKQFSRLEEQYFQDHACERPDRQHTSLSREYISSLCERLGNTVETENHEIERGDAHLAGASLRASERLFQEENKEAIRGSSSRAMASKNLSYPRRLMKSASVNSSSNPMAPTLMSRNASTKRSTVDIKKERAVSDVPVVHSRSHFFGFSLKRRIPTIYNDQPRD